MSLTDDLHQNVHGDDATIEELGAFAVSPVRRRRDPWLAVAIAVSTLVVCGAFVSHAFDPASSQRQRFDTEIALPSAVTPALDARSQRASIDDEVPAQPAVAWTAAREGAGASCDVRVSGLAGSPATAVRVRIRDVDGDVLVAGSASLRVADERPSVSGDHRGLATFSSTLALGSACRARGVWVEVTAVDAAGREGPTDMGYLAVVGR